MIKVALQLGQKRPVHGGDRLGGIFVSGHEHGCGGDAPVGQGNAGIRQHPGGGGDPGHDLERNARVTQTSPLLAAATEYVRIAAFETHHLAAGAGMLDQKLIDLLLGGPLSLSAFAHEQLFAALAGKLEKPLVQNLIIEDEICVREVVRSFNRDQPGIAGTGADEVDVTGFGQGRIHC